VQPLFYAQLEAAETLIFLVEGPADLRQGIQVPMDEPGTAAKEAGYRPFKRYALKMATGSGKTTVMGMLAAWSIGVTAHDDEHWRHVTPAKLLESGGSDGTRTRGLRRDRPAL
jgi:hypothetical protein